MFGVINCPFDDMESQLPVVSNIMIYILFGMLLFIFKKTVNKFSSNIRKFIEQKIVIKKQLLPLTNINKESHYGNLMWDSVNIQKKEDTVINNISGHIIFNKINLFCGSNKDTNTLILKALIGIPQRDIEINGKIFFKDEIINSLNKKVRFGWIDNTNNLSNMLTLNENICFNYLIYNKFNTNLAYEFTSEWLDKLGLTELSGTYINNVDELDFNIKFKINLLFELSKNPEILVFNDYVINNDKLDLYNQLLEQGYTIILTIDTYHQILTSYVSHLIVFNDIYKVSFCGSIEEITKIANIIEENTDTDKITSTLNTLIDGTLLCQNKIIFTDTNSYFSKIKRNRRLNTITISFLKRFLLITRDVKNITINLTGILLSTMLIGLLFNKHDLFYKEFVYVITIITILITYKAHLINNRLKTWKSYIISDININHVYFGESLADIFFNNLWINIFTLSWLSCVGLTSNYSSILGILSLYSWMIETFLTSVFLLFTYNWIVHCILYISLIYCILVSNHTIFISYIFPMKYGIESLYYNEINEPNNISIIILCSIGLIFNISTYFIIKYKMYKTNKIFFPCFNKIQIFVRSLRQTNITEYIDKITSKHFEMAQI
jgi:ABC-type multidrug transport system ATPase subunit